MLADVLMRTGAASLWLIALVAAGTTWTLMDAVAAGAFEYLAVMTVFGLVALGLLVAGKRLRRTATHWDND